LTKKVSFREQQKCKNLTDFFDKEEVEEDEIDEDQF